jgi:hypothetical protein
MANRSIKTEVGMSETGLTEADIKKRLEAKTKKEQDEKDSTAAKNIEAVKPRRRRAYKVMQDFNTLLNNSYVECKKGDRLTDPDDTYLIEHCLANELPIAPDSVEFVQCPCGCDHIFAVEK